MAREVYRRFSGETLRRSRLASGLTLAELGKRIGVGGETVRHWEVGISSPRSRRLPKVAEALGLKIEDLYESPDNEASLADLRRAAGLTQEQLAKKLGTYKTKVSGWERGKSRMPLELLDVYANILGVAQDKVYDASDVSAGVTATFTREEVVVGEQLVDGHTSYFASSPDSRFEIQLSPGGIPVNLHMRGEDFGDEAFDAEILSRSITLVMQQAMKAAAAAHKDLHRRMLAGEQLTSEQLVIAEMYGARLKVRESLAKEQGQPNELGESGNQ